MESYGQDVGIAILDYSLIPEAHFPVPLLQAVIAIKNLFSRGVKPSNLILTGDSAGGNLIVQVLLHAIHPLAGIPTLFESPKEESKFAGAYLMSPWLTLLARDERSQKFYRENGNWDLISPKTITDFATAVLAGIKEEQHHPYIDFHFAPSGWYDGMGGVVKKMLITAGRYECFKEDIERFGEQLETAARTGNLDMKLVVDEYGIHDDPFLDFMAGEKKLGELTPIIISWCRDAFRA